MAETNFYLSITERDSFFNFCLLEECVLVPDKHYSSNKVEFIENRNELQTHSGNLGFFILHREYFRYPLEMSQITKDEEIKYYIKQRYGGPHVYFHSPIYAEIENRRIGPGSLSIYPFYYSGTEKIIAPEPFKKHFTILSNYVKGISTKVSLNKRTYWIGRKTLDLVNHNKLKLVGFNNG